jgi:hypothetical protein
MRVRALNWSMTTEANMYLKELRVSDGFQAMISESGWLGKGPQDVRGGDKIVLICWANPQFIVRGRDAGGYNLIWEAYVHGIRDAEFMDREPAVEIIEPF